MLRVSNLTVAVDGRDPIISDVSFSLSKGEILAIFGPSGSGKSTLLNAIAGFIDVRASDAPGMPRNRLFRPRWFAGNQGRLIGHGSICIDGEDMESFDAQSRPVGLVLQKFGVYPHMTAFANIAFPLRCRGIDKTEIEARVSKAAEMAGLDPQDFPRRVKSLSGGEAQRVAIAKMLAKGASVALMDEPFSHLDQLRRSDLIQLIRRLVDNAEQGMDCAVIISHDWRELRYADQAILLNARGDAQKVVRLFKRKSEGWHGFEEEALSIPFDQQERKWIDGLRGVVAQ